ncbi:MAG: glycosyltransferase family 2 protein [Elusimicrobiota bacterium]
MQFSLVIPFYNEEKNAESVCHEIVEIFSRHNLNYELIAVNNGSRDKTAQLLEQLADKHPVIKIVNVAVNQGYGYGVLQGLKTAQGDYVGYSVGDGQISAEDVYKVYKEAAVNNLDYCQGKRIGRKDSFLRTLNTKFFHFIFHLLYNNNITDNGSNPKILKKTWYEKMKLVSKDWFLDSEIILKTSILNGSMKEIPVTFIKRKEGKSKVNIWGSLKTLKSVLIWKFKLIGQSK